MVSTGSETKVPTPAQTGAGLVKPADRAAMRPLQPSTGGADGSAAGAPSSHGGAVQGLDPVPPSGVDARFVVRHQAMADAMNLIRGGATIRAAALQAGVGDSTVSNVIRARGLTLGQLRGGPEWTAAPGKVSKRAARVAAVLAEGATVNEAAARLGLHRRHVLQCRGEIDPALWRAAIERGIAQNVQRLAGTQKARFDKARAARIAVAVEMFQRGLNLAEAAAAMGLSLSVMEKLRRHIPVSARPAPMGKPAIPGRLEAMVEAVEAGADWQDLREKFKTQRNRAQAFFAKHKRGDLVAAAEAHVASRRAARRLAKGTAPAPRPPKPQRIMVRMPEAAPVAAPEPLRPVAAFSAKPPRPAAQPVPSQFDARTEEQAELVATKGRAAALDQWRKPYGLTMTQAWARWHRLPQALKGL